MGKKGRPCKSGKRYANGRRKPGAVTYDRGSEWVAARKERFGAHYSSALGRCYASGLMGDDADRLFDAGKAFARAHNRVFGGPGYRCPLDDTPRGTLHLADDPDIMERDHRQQQWLIGAMDALDVDGSRPWLDQLIHTNYIDQGPPWLDRLLAGGEDPVDLMFLNAAMRALDIIAPAKQGSRIRVA